MGKVEQNKLVIDLVEIGSAAAIFWIWFKSTKPGFDARRCYNLGLELRGPRRQRYRHYEEQHRQV